MLNLVTSKRAYRLIPVLALAFAAIFILLAGPASQTHAEAQAFPPWSFKPISSTVPPGLQSPEVVEIGEQRELFVSFVSNTVKSYALVIGGVATPILAMGAPAPGGGTFIDVNGVTAYIASPNLIYLTTSVDDNSSTVLRHFRWSNSLLTPLTPTVGVSYKVDMNDAHGRFIAKRSVDATHTEYWITDGDLFNSASISLLNQDLGASPRTEQRLIGITAGGAFLVHERITSGTIECSRRSPASAQPAAPSNQTTAGRIFWLGSRSGTIASGTYTTIGCGGNGLVIFDPVLNSAGDVLSWEATYAGNSGGFTSILTKLWLYPGNGGGTELVAQGEQIGNVGPYFFIQPKALTTWRQPIFKAATDPQNNTTALFSGPSPASDRFDGDFMQGFGQDGTPLELYNFSEKGDALVYARLANNTNTYALGHSGTLEWVNANGGNWADAANWDPVQVPDQSAETLFRLEATYDVTVSTRTSGRSRIENGSVSFRNADLTLIGPLSIGGDAKLTLPAGTLNAGEITIGHLPPISPLTPTLAQLYVSNAGTIITGNTAIDIGAASEGELFVSDATLYSSQVRIGVTSPGTAIIGGQHGKWSTDAVAVGHNTTGTLTIEQGGFLRSGGEVIIGNGTTMQDRTAVVHVSNDNAPATGFGNWLAFDTFSIGNFQRGELYLSKGGQINVFNDQSVLQAGLRAHPGPGLAAFISIDGSDDTAAITSTLSVFNDVLLGMVHGAAVGVNVDRGGQFIVDGANLFLGFAAGSEVTMTVAGINAHTAPALLKVSAVAGTFTTGHCAIGESGTGRLLIHSGGQVQCQAIRIGGQPGSTGYVSVDGANGGSTLYTEGGLCIGGDLVELCGAADSGLQGTLELRNSGNAVSERGTLVGPGGRVTGSGDLLVGVLGLDVADGGVIDPGVTVLTSGKAAVFAAPALPIIQPGVLNIGGNVSISPTAVITLDVIGNTPSLYDRLIITGTAKLGGKLVLNFGNGFAPKQGESYNFMQAGAFASAFQTTTIAGLAPGFTYTLSATGGALNLVALNDGVPTTQASRRVYLPLIRR